MTSDSPGYDEAYPYEPRLAEQYAPPRRTAGFPRLREELCAAIRETAKEVAVWTGARPEKLEAGSLLNQE